MLILINDGSFTVTDSTGKGKIASSAYYHNFLLNGGRLVLNSGTIANPNGTAIFNNYTDVIINGGTVDNVLTNPDGRAIMNGGKAVKLEYPSSVSGPGVPVFNNGEAEKVYFNGAEILNDPQLTAAKVTDKNKSAPDLRDVVAILKMS